MHAHTNTRACPYHPTTQHSMHASEQDIIQKPIKEDTMIQLKTFIPK